MAIRSDGSPESPARGRGGRAGARKKIGEMLIEAGVINRQKVEQALSMAQRSGERLGQVLVRAGFVRGEQIAEALAGQFGVDYLPPGQVSRSLIDREAVGTVPLKLLQETHVLPIVLKGTPSLLVADPLDLKGTDRVETAIGRRPYVITTTSAIDMVLQILSFELVDSERIIESARESIEQGELQALFEYILGRAVLERASDIHLEPSGLTTVVRYRIDGQLRTAIALPRSRHENLTNIIFSRAGVDVSDFGRLHDGRFSFDFASRKLDIRFASSPSVEGPMIVLRILDDTRSLATLEEIGYSSRNMAAINDLLRHPNGLILVVGPTGSGKTTSLYSCLSRLNDGATKILTVEDPVEIRLPSIQQVQVNDKAGVTFSRTIRAFLRQDPDVILVGEIRDEETAREAFRAANTGHLVLTTLHANSAMEAIGRLLDLGMDSYQVASTLLGSMSQRLLRKVCRHCCKREELSCERFEPQLLENAALSPAHMLRVVKPGPGCVHCSDGYGGRTVAAEVLRMTPEVRQLVHQRAPNDAIIEVARRQGFSTLLDDAFRLVGGQQVPLAEAEDCVGPLTIAAAG